MPTSKSTVMERSPSLRQTQSRSGVNTSLPMIVAEELDANWDDVVCRQHLSRRTTAPNSRVVHYQYPCAGMNFAKWVQPRARCCVRRQRNSGESHALNLPLQINGCAFWQWKKRQLQGACRTAASIPVPEESSVTLKSASDYQLLGKRVVNASAADIVVGNPIFGIDATAPGMVYATYVKCPSIGGIAKSANLDAVKVLPALSMPLF